MTTDSIDTNELARILAPQRAPGRTGQTFLERSAIRKHLATAAAAGWIVQDPQGHCWWADEDGRWYHQGEAAALLTRTMHGPTKAAR